MIGSRRSWRTSPALHFAAALGLCALATVGPVSLAAGAPGPDGHATFSVSPANPDPNDPLTRAYFRPVVTAGTAVTEAVNVTDTGDTPVELFVYPVDGLTGATSGTVYANRSDPRTRAGTWVTTSISTVTIAAHQQKLVPFRIDVPAAATPGDHVAGIAFEDAHPTHGAGFSVTEVIREVVGVQVRVPGPGQFHLHVDGVSFVSPPAAPAVSVVLHLGDDGNRLGQPRLLVNLRGPDGYVHAIDHQLDTLLPGDTIAYPLPWPEPLKPGTYTVSVLSNGADPTSYTGTGQLTAASPGPIAATGPTTAPAPSHTALSAPGTASVHPKSGRSGLPVFVITLACCALIVLLVTPSARRELRARRARAGATVFGSDAP